MNVNTETITSVEAARQLREIRNQLEALGVSDLNASAEYRLARLACADACARDVDRWKERAGYAKAEADMGRDPE